MKTGLKEFVAIGAAGLALLACEKAEPTDVDLAKGQVGDAAASVVNSSNQPPLPEGVVRGGPNDPDQLYGICVLDGEPLDREQFPMKRGTELLKRLEDGTCLETLQDGNERVIYAIHGNSKIKFSDPNPDQEAIILAQSSFEDLKEAAIRLLDVIKDSAIEGKCYAKGDDLLGVLFEGPISECPVYRFRRLMFESVNIILGAECIWDEPVIDCTTVTTSNDSSSIIWEALPGKEGLMIPDSGRRTPAGRLPPGPAPTPREWIGGEPACPSLNSVVNIDF
jgi:hypothetical protein